MTQANTIIKAFRALYPNASIACTITPSVGEAAIIRAAISNDGGPSSTVESITTMSNLDIVGAQDKAISRAIELMGVFVEGNAELEQGMPHGESTVPAKTTLGKRKKVSEPAPMAETLIEQPVSKPDEEGLKNEEEPNTIIDESEAEPQLSVNPSTDSLVEAGTERTDAKTVREEERDDDTVSGEGISGTDVEPSQKSVEQRKGEVAQEPATEPNEALTAAIATQLDITDPARKVSMKKFIGLTLGEIAAERPSLLRNIQKEADRGNYVCSETCLAAVKLVIEAKVGK